MSLADFVVAGVVSWGATINLDAELRKELPHVVRHVETVVNQPAVKDIFGPLQYVEKALVFTPPPKEKAKVEKAPAAPKPKKAVEADEEEDEKPIEEPKAKHPCELLPKSPLVMDDWKRAYSNMDTRGAGGSLEWFYQQ